MADIDDDDPEGTDPQVQEVEWQPPTRKPARKPATAGGVLLPTRPEGQRTEGGDQAKVSPKGGYFTLAILALVVSFVICAALGPTLLWELAALTILICVPAGAAAAFMGWRASNTKKNESTPAVAGKGS